MTQLEPDRQVAPRRIGRVRRRVLMSTAVLPGLMTILNGVAGFGSIHYATKDALGQATSRHLLLAAWLILAAMVLDMLDGRLARIARRTSDFGAQLDSLCDVVSFGVAPAVLMLRAAVAAMPADMVGWLPTGMAVRIVWCIAAIYVAFAAMRLARFNVESDASPSPHMTFRGLPSPGAAAVVVTLVLLSERLESIQTGWRSNPGLLIAVSVALPVMTLLAGMLMMSTFSYAHVINRYVRGKRPLSYLVKLVFLVILFLIEPYVAGAMLALVYALSGPVGPLWQRARRGVAPPT